MVRGETQRSQLQTVFSVSETLSYNAQGSSTRNVGDVFGTGIMLRGQSDVSQWPDRADCRCVHRERAHVYQVM